MRLKNKTVKCWIQAANTVQMEGLENPGSPQDKHMLKLGWAALLLWIKSACIRILVSCMPVKILSIPRLSHDKGHVLAAQ